MDIGKVIKKARLEKGMTQEMLAEKVGVKKSAVAKWENGRVSEIKRTNLKKLSTALGLNPNSLLDSIEEHPVETANELANIFMDYELMEMIRQYKTLDMRQKSQVREYVRLLSGSK